jgi:four helix bundle protein
VTDFKKLKVWQKAHVMAMDVHRVAGQIRGAKHASLRSQMIRAAMSIPTNIVEGCSQQSAREYSRFVRIALIRRRSSNTTFLPLVTLQRLAEQSP